MSSEMFPTPPRDTSSGRSGRTFGKASGGTTPVSGATPREPLDYPAQLLTVEQDTLRPQVLDGRLDARRHPERVCSR